MRIRRKNRGFTLAEMLVVMAIIGILGGVSVIAVQSHRRSTTRMEHDTIAKEIFIAAQNHLTMAESQGFLGFAKEDAAAYGTPYEASAKKADDSSESVAAYYIAHKAGESFVGGSMLNLMLPPGAIDETVRGSGSYIIYYQPRPALVLDVFYWDDASDFGGCDDFDALMAYKGDDKTGARQNHTPIIGWYGGVDARASGDMLEMPTIEVFNGEALTVVVDDPNLSTIEGTALKLYIQGVTSKARASIQLRYSTTKEAPDRVTALGSEYTVTLDDVTKLRMHFADLNTEGKAGSNGDEGSSNGIQFDFDSPVFIPGEDIIIEAVAYSDSKLTSIAYSNRVTTNSLFADLDAVESQAATADPDTGVVTSEAVAGSARVKIASFRHLANLNGAVSGFKAITDDEAVGVDPEDQKDSFTNKFGETVAAEQIADLDWSELSELDSSVCVHNLVEECTNAGCFLPVSASYPLAYDGKGHSISKVKVDNTGESGGESDTSVAIAVGGVFGALEDSSISNLELIDTSVRLTAGNAGALAGTLTGCTVTNVLARNGVGALTENIASTGNVGGLIGEMHGGRVEKSAAALIVIEEYKITRSRAETNKHNAGGLIGAIYTRTDAAASEGGASDPEAEGASEGETSDVAAIVGSVVGCYSGGHTAQGRYEGEDKEDAGLENFNVTAAYGCAGGLIGDANDAEISCSYSTCSVAGATAGGFVGASTAASGKISNCYATGLVCGKQASDGTKTEGAFAGSLTVLEGGEHVPSYSALNDCRYYMIVNERVTERELVSGEKAYSYSYLQPVGTPVVSGEGEAAAAVAPAEGAIIALDVDALEFNKHTKLGKADVYDSMLTVLFGSGAGSARQSQYTLPSVEQLGLTLKTSEEDKTKYFVATHYGDWPAPETFVVNVINT